LSERLPIISIVLSRKSGKNARGASADHAAVAMQTIGTIARNAKTPTWRRRNAVSVPCTTIAPTPTTALRTPNMPVSAASSLPSKSETAPVLNT
jgi:hypothetical protein